VGRHSARGNIVPFRLGVVSQKPKEIPEYTSEDVEFDWFEAYVPPFPLTYSERRLEEFNNGYRSPG
jgi:hypothetical protein